MNIPEFRSEFPEFKDTALYPTPMIQFWATLAEQQVLQKFWCGVWQTGVKLYVAHEITLAGQNVKTAANGGTPGQNSGIANNKTVGSVTVGYDSNTNTEKDAGYWNLTNYGKQFYRLVKMFGAGCIQL